MFIAHAYEVAKNLQKPIMSLIKPIISCKIYL